MNQRWFCVLDIKKRFSSAPLALRDACSTTTCTQLVSFYSILFLQQQQKLLSGCYWFSPRCLWNSNHALSLALCKSGWLTLSSLYGSRVFLLSVARRYTHRRWQIGHIVLQIKAIITRHCSVPLSCRRWWSKNANQRELAQTRAHSQLTAIQRFFHNENSD